MMLTDKRLAEILIEKKLLSEKGLRNARERQRNAENESLEESLIFMGLADYAKLGRAYSIHYKLPYYPIFHNGIDAPAKERFPLPFVKRTLVLPAAKEVGQKFTIVGCEPDSEICKSQVTQLARGGKIDWQVASHIEIEDAISHYYLNQRIKRETLEIKLPFEFKILDADNNPDKSVKQPAGGSAGNHSDTVKVNGKRVILIEPDHKFRGLMSALLEQEGYRITAVIDADEAIKELLAEDAAYLLTRRIFRSRTRHVEDSISEHKLQVEIRYFSNLGGIILGEELSSEELFRNYLATVKLLFDTLTINRPEITSACRITAHYARLLVTTSGLKRKSQQALLLAIYLKEIGNYGQDHASEINIFSLVPMPPYEKSAIMLEKIEDSFGLSEIISKINQPAAVSPIESRIITLLIWFIEKLSPGNEKEITANDFYRQLDREPAGLIDKQLAEELLQIISHEQHLNGRTHSSGVILVIDPTFERDHGDLYNQLVKENYEINFAQNAEQATAFRKQQHPLLIISEIGDDNYNGIKFCEESKRNNPNLPFIFFTAEDHDKIISKALTAGADDFLSKESSYQVLFLKMNRFIQRSRSTQNQIIGSGVSGSLQEMGFMETVQILANREKDALIKLTDQENNQATVYLHAGEIIYASYKNLEGEPAVYELLNWEDGFFQVETPDKLPERNVFGSTEAIMLEGCRLLDEELRDIKEVTI